MQQKCRQNERIFICEGFSESTGKILSRDITLHCSNSKLLTTLIYIKISLFLMKKNLRESSQTNTYSCRCFVDFLSKILKKRKQVGFK